MMPFKDDLMMLSAIYKKGLFGFGAGVMLAVNAATPVQGFPPDSISPTSNNIRPPRKSNPSARHSLSHAARSVTV